MKEILEDVFCYIFGGLFLLLFFVGVLFMAYTIEAEASQVLYDDLVVNRVSSQPKSEVYSLPDYNSRYLDAESYDILCRIVEAEATGGTIEQKRNVASCVMNRLYSKEWPNSIKAVVFQKKQFSPIDDGRYYKVTVTNSTREAVDLTLDEGLLHECFYFCTPTCKSYKSGWFSTLKEEFQDGIHAYFIGGKK